MNENVTELVRAIASELENLVPEFMKTKTTILASGRLNEEVDIDLFSMLDHAAISVSELKHDLDLFLSNTQVDKEWSVESETTEAPFFERRAWLINEMIDTAFDGSYSKAAKAAGVSPDTIKRIVNNENTGRRSTLEKIGVALNLDLVDLMP